MIRCPNLREDATRERFNALVERLGGKPLQQSDVTSRRAYHDSLNRAQRNAYSRAHALWSEAGGNSDAALARLDMLDRLRSQARVIDTGSIPAFAGERAKTADNAALAEAQKMEGDGKPREDIWSKTGWFRGVDGKWRFEVDDSGAVAATGIGHLRDLLFHPRLWRSYPDLGGVRAGFEMKPVSPTGEHSPAGILAIGRDEPSLRSVGLHESQHGVQVGEGFAPGSNVMAAGRDHPAIKDIEARIAKLAKRARDPETPSYDVKAIEKRVAELERERAQLVPYYGQDVYHRSAGEVEARTVQKRMDMTPDERRARPPWLDYDVPEDQQIILGVQPKDDGTPLQRHQTGALRLTTDAMARRQEIIDALVNKLQKMLPADVAVSVSHRLFSADGTEMFGAFRPSQRLIELALAYGPEKAIAIGAHEVVHVLREAKAFTDPEWLALVNRARDIGIADEMRRRIDPVTGNTVDVLAKYRTFYEKRATKMRLSDDLAKRFVDRMIEEELVAALAEKHFAPAKAKFGERIDALLKRMRDIMDAVVAAFNGVGLRRPEDVFRRMERGDIAKRVAPVGREATRLVAQRSIVDEEDARGLGQMWQASQRTMRFAIRTDETTGKPVSPEERQSMVAAMQQKDDGTLLAMSGANKAESSAEGKRSFKFDSYPDQGTVTTNERSDGLRHRIYAVVDNGTTIVQAMTVEREPDRWELAGMRLDRSSHGRGIAVDLVKAIEDDMGQMLLPSGIVTPDVYLATRGISPDLVRYHVPAGAEFDGLYLPPKSIKAMRNVLEGVAANDDSAAADLAALKTLEASVKDEAFAVERTAADMARMAAKPRPKLSLSGSANDKAKAALEAKRIPPSPARSITETRTVSPQLAAMFGIPDGSKIEVNIAHILDSRNRKDGHRLPEFFTSPEKASVAADTMLATAPFAVRYHNGKADSWSLIGKVDGIDVMLAINLTPDKHGIYRAQTMYEIYNLTGKLLEALGAKPTIADIRLREGSVSAGQTLHALLQATRQSRAPHMTELINSVRAEQAKRKRIETSGDMPALAPGSGSVVPTHLPNAGDISRSDISAPEQSLSDLVRMLNEAIMAPHRIGRLSPGMKAAMGRLGAKLYGQFSRSTGIARIAMPNDIVTLAHEGGHGLEIHPDIGPLVEGIKQTYSAELIPLATPGANQLSEGWAEFFSLFIIDPSAAHQKAPRTAQAFRNMLESADKDMLTALEAVQTGYAAYIGSSPAGVVRSRVRSVLEKQDGQGFISDIRQRGVSAAMQDRLYALTKNVTDKDHPLRAAVDFLMSEAAKLPGAAVKAGEKLIIKRSIDDPYKLMRMMSQARVHATAALQYGIRLNGKVSGYGPSMRDVLGQAFGGFTKDHWSDDKFETFGAYLVARRMNAEWDRYDIGDLKDPPDHLMGRDAWGKAERDLASVNPQFVKAGQMLDAFTKTTLEWKYENGFLTEAQFDDFVNRDGYAPLQRIFDDQGGIAGIRSKGDNRRALIFRFKGSTRDFINPVESLIQDVYTTQSRVEINRVIKALVKLARAAGPNGGTIAEVIPSKDMRVTNIERATVPLRDAAKKTIDDAVMAGALSMSAGQQIADEIDLLFDADAAKLMFSAVDTTSRKGERIVYLWQDGKRTPILLGNNTIGEDIFNMFAAVGEGVATDPIFDMLVGGTQLFRAGVTKSPSYLVVNWLRDQLSTWVLSRHFIPFWHGFHRVSGQSAEMYKHFAGISGIESHLIDSLAKGDVEQLHDTRFTAAPTKWKRFLRMMEYAETATRVGHMEAAFRFYKSEGWTDEEAAFEAAYAAHDVMDFSRHGAKTLLVSRLVAFLNAQLQGLSAAVRTAKGEHDDFNNIRDVLSPYLRASEGTPLGIGEREKLPTSAQMFMKLVVIGFIGLALALIHRDDPEYEEVAKSQMGHTHWFFKLGGHWWRIPKPFELAIFSNLFEAMYARLADGDPTWMQRFGRSLRDTVLISPEMQVWDALTTIKHGATGLIDSITGRMQYDKNKGGTDVPQRLRGLPPELQWDAYTSELSRLMAATFGISAYKTDNVVRSMLANVGKDFLTVTDLILPSINRATGGVLPGVSREARPDKSLEDTIFISRLARRAGRGAYSTAQFWQDMSQDAGRLTTAASGFKNLMDNKQMRREAMAMLAGMDDDTRAYTILSYYYKEGDKDLHPMHRAQQVIQAMNGIRQQMVENGGITIDSKHRKGRPDERIVLNSADMRTVNEIIETMAMREARNAQIALGKTGWVNARVMSNDKLMDELRAAVPQVADELEYRLQHGRGSSYTFDGVAEQWQAVKRQLLTEEPGSSLAEYRAAARAARWR